MIPGLFRAIVDEADSVLIDEAVTPLIISNSPEGNANSRLYEFADDLAQQLDAGRDFTIDWTVRNVDLTERGQRRLDELSDADPEHRGFWKGKRRREELVTQALVGPALLCPRRAIPRRRRKQGGHHRRIHRPHHGRPFLAARPASGHRSQGRTSRSPATRKTWRASAFSGFSGNTSSWRA